MSCLRALLLWLSAPIVFVTARPEQAQAILDSSSNEDPQPYKIAIVGAGAAGSSAAYHLSRFIRDSPFASQIPNFSITIFETDSRIGGRTTTTNALNDPRYPVEVGASIFVEINQILYNATRDFGLLASTRDSSDESTGSAYDLGIWDGNTFRFTLANDDGRGMLKGTLGEWWDVAKIIWRYGLSAFRVRSLRNNVIARFLRMYDERDAFPFYDLTEVAEQVNLLPITNQTGQKLLREAGVGNRMASELVQASTRVNYAQNLADFHGLETMVCMSTDGAMSIEGGNWRIFDAMVQLSGAKVHYNTTVHAIDTSPNGSTLAFRDTSESSEPNETAFDTVILAAPYNASRLKLTPRPSHTPNKDVDYVRLHVTLFTSPFRPDPIFFGLKKNEEHLIPDTILTTLPPELESFPLGRGINAVGLTQFWSLSTLRVINPTTDSYIPDGVSSGHIPLENLLPHNVTIDEEAWLESIHGKRTDHSNGKQYIYKIFSPAPLDADYLIDLFGWEQYPTLPEDLVRESSSERTENEKKLSIDRLPKGLVSWSHEKAWTSYPYEVPRDEFDCFDVYDCKRKDDAVPAPEADPGAQTKREEQSLKGKLWYTSPMESFISTMETSALSGMNVARLIVDRLEEQARL